MRTDGSSWQRPVARLKCCLYTGDATTSSPFRSPTMPRERTFARENGSRLPTAWTLPSASRNTATCSPPTSAHTPVSGTMSSSRQTRIGSAAPEAARQGGATGSCRFKVRLPLFGSSGADLAALGDEHHAGVGRVAVHEVAEALQDLRGFERLLPFAAVALDELLHVGFQLGADAEGVLAHRLPHVVDAALETLQPDAGALQPIAGADIEHE